MFHGPRRVQHQHFRDRGRADAKSLAAKFEQQSSRQCSRFRFEEIIMLSLISVFVGPPVPSPRRYASAAKWSARAEGGVACPS